MRPTGPRPSSTGPTVDGTTAVSTHRGSTRRKVWSPTVTGSPPTSTPRRRRSTTPVFSGTPATPSRPTPTLSQGHPTGRDVSTPGGRPSRPRGDPRPSRRPRPVPLVSEPVGFSTRPCPGRDTLTGPSGRVRPGVPVTTTRRPRPRHTDAPHGPPDGSPYPVTSGVTIGAPSCSPRIWSRPRPSV